MGTDNYRKNFQYDPIRTDDYGKNFRFDPNEIVLTARKYMTSFKSHIQLIISDGSIIAKDTSINRRAVVKKCDLDKYDLEKGVLYALAKMHGFTAKDIQRLIDNAIDIRKKEND